MDERDLEAHVLEAAKDGVPSRFFALRLVVPDAALAVDLDRPEMVLGRHSEADVRLPLPDVSRRHCRFVYTNGEWHVWDLNSLNGIFVNGMRVQHAVLQPQDTLSIGGFTFEVRQPGQTMPLKPGGKDDTSTRVLRHTD